MRYGKFLVILSFISILCMCSCVNNKTYLNDIYNLNNGNENKDIVIEDNKLDLNINSSLNINHTMNHSMNHTIHYEIIKYGKFGNRDDKFFYSYIDKSDNSTIIMIFTGKKPVDYHIKITKILRNSGNSITVYINKTADYNNRIITSPYIIVKVNGTYDNVKFIEN